MATNTPLECGICDEAFDEEERCPRILPCYHHFCNECIEHLIKNASKRCPFCRAQFEADCAKDVKINFGVLDLVKFISRQASKYYVLRPSEPEQSVLHTREIIDSMKETERTSRCLLVTCQGVQSLIDKSVQDMVDLKITFQQQSDLIKSEILSKFNEILTNNVRHEEEITIRENKVKDYQNELREKQEQLENLKKKLRISKTEFTEDTDIRNEVQEANTAIGEWIENLRGIVTDDRKMLETVQKEVETATVITERVKDAFLYPGNDEWIEHVQDLASITTTPQEPLSCSSAVELSQKTDSNPTAPEEPISCCSAVGPTQMIHYNPTAPQEPESCGSNTGPVHISPTAPEATLGWHTEQINPGLNKATMNTQLPYKRDMNIDMLLLPSLKYRVEEGMVYTIQQDKSRLRFARISVFDDKLHLHCLRDTAPPPHVNVIEQSDVLKLVSPSSRLTFFDISVGYKQLGRIYIRLNSNSKGAQNFSLLCTGEMGPSYRNTKIFTVEIYKGTDMEVVQGGDYEFKTGKGGKTLVSGLNLSEKIYKQNWSAGTVRGVSYHLFGQFYINLRDRPNSVCHGAIGMVEKGLNILVDAVSQATQVNEIIIYDCGIVIPYNYFSTARR